MPCCSRRTRCLLQRQIMPPRKRTVPEEPGAPDLPPAGYALVAVNQPVDQAYWYGAIEGAVAGGIVEVPFSGRQARGCILQLKPDPPPSVAASKMKRISRV